MIELIAAIVLGQTMTADVIGRVQVAPNLIQTEYIVDDNQIVTITEFVR
jgi:hypothetical protein